MRVVFPLLLLLFNFTLSAQKQECDKVIRGQVLDLVTQEPLPFATVEIVESRTGVATDEEGHFKISDICEQEVHLEVRFIGYRSLIHHHDFHHPSPVIYLASEDTLIEGIVIEESRITAFKSLAIQKKEIDDLASVTATIGQLTGQISGVSMLKTGVNIEKPMVHGLHSNRVLVVNQGVRHAYQMWGEEHAPEIDPSQIEGISIVKGAGTVKYGPEALGGVILYNANKLSLDKKLGGSASTAYQSNGRAMTGKVSMEQGSHRFAWKAGAFYTHQGDLHAADYNLTNTGKRELGGSIQTLIHQPKFDVEISASYFEQELGILRASIVGNLTDLTNSINRSQPSPTNSFTYDIANPKQETVHGLVKSEATFFLDEHTIKTQYAFQKNLRQEFDVRRGELNDRPVIDLSLNAHNIDVEWTQPSQNAWNGHSGIQFYTQKSINAPGSNPVNFVPDYQMRNSGIYTVQTYKINTTTFEFGARFDHQYLSVSDSIRDVSFYENEVQYNNTTFTLGLNKRINQKTKFHVNLGSAWRAPNVAELYSFGYHQSRYQYGIWRFQFDPISTNDILSDETHPQQPEKSIKLVSGIEVEKKRLKADFVFYANHINNYIFLRPYGITVGIRGTFPYFVFDQAQALFIGTDWDLRYKHSQMFSSELKVSYVHARERKTNQPLPDIPPLNMNYQLEMHKGNWEYGIDLNYTSRQWYAPSVIAPEEFQFGTAEVSRDEYFDFMAPPEGYLLIGSKVKRQFDNWNIQVSGSNLFNTSYRVYTDRLRYFADSPGRNIALAIQYQF